MTLGRKVILIDMDGPLADFESGFLTDWRRCHQNAPFVPLKDRRTFYVRDDYPLERRDEVESIYFARGFYRCLPPVAGSLAAVAGLEQSGHDVWICTAPLGKYENCVLEKYEWVERHLGRRFTKRIIMTKDKSLIRGDILIDDRPDPEGEALASWRHILYSMPFNRRVRGKPRLTWRTWRRVLLSTLLGMR